MTDTQTLKDLRRTLHAHAELSHKEFETQKILKDFLKPYAPSEVIGLAGGKALLVSFDSGKPGPHALFRADMDALPIEERNQGAYASKHKGHSHACGHDGHMTLVASLAAAWQGLASKSGKLGLIFQHAEELGEGAKEACDDPALKAWKPSVVFGFHNIPGAPLGEVMLGDKIFACASTGLRMDFTGVSSHAAEPGKAHSPLAVVPTLLQLAQHLISPAHDEKFFLATPVHVQIGRENYGITPGIGRLCFTLRSLSDETLKRGLESLLQSARELCEREGLKLETQLIEPFPSVPVHSAPNALVEKAAKETGLAVRHLDFPFLWSEDFGYFTQAYPGTYFGLGIGEDRPGLHDPSYDFNDEALAPYSRLVAAILAQVYT